MLDEQLIFPIFSRVAKVLKIFTEEPTFFPRQQDMEELNPTRDPQKRRIHRIESCWDWRNRVIKSMRTTTELYLWEMPYWRRYLTAQERYFFFRYWNDDEWCEECGKAIIKLDKNFVRLGVYWE